MFEDPAFPSLPPPPEDASIKPMSVIGAAMWVTGAQIVFLWGVSLAAALKGGESYDLIGLTICQVAAYLFVLYLVLRVHAPNTPIRDLLAIRHTNPWFYVLALLISLASTFPSWWLLDQVERIYPPGERLFEWLDVFYTLSAPEKYAVAFGTVVIGPFAEEMLFRGAVYRPMRINKRPVAVVVVTALLFAAVHLDAHKMVPLTIMGLLLGYLRWASGSLLPPFLMHLAFNAVPFVDLLSQSQPPTDTDPVPISYVTAGAGVAVLALLFTHALARSSRRASSARREDK